MFLLYSALTTAKSICHLFQNIERKQNKNKPTEIKRLKNGHKKDKADRMKKGIKRTEMIKTNKQTEKTTIQIEKVETRM